MNESGVAGLIQGFSMRIYCMVWVLRREKRDGVSSLVGKPLPDCKEEDGVVDSLIWHGVVRDMWSPAF